MTACAQGPIKNFPLIVMPLRLTDYVEITHSSLGLLCVDLTHVGPLVRPLNVFDVQIPSSIVTLRWDPDARISRNNAVHHRQDGWAMIMNPSHLRASKQIIAANLVIQRPHVELQCVFVWQFSTL